MERGHQMEGARRPGSLVRGGTVAGGQDPGHRCAEVGHVVEVDQTGPVGYLDPGAQRCEGVAHTLDHQPVLPTVLRRFEERGRASVTAAGTSGGPREREAPEAVTECGGTPTRSSGLAPTN